PSEGACKRFIRALLDAVQAQGLPSFSKPRCKTGLIGAGFSRPPSGGTNGLQPSEASVEALLHVAVSAGDRRSAPISAKVRPSPSSTALFPDCCCQRSTVTSQYLGSSS